MSNIENATTCGDIGEKSAASNNKTTTTEAAAPTTATTTLKQQQYLQQLQQQRQQYTLQHNQQQHQHPQQQHHHHYHQQQQQQHHQQKQHHYPEKTAITTSAGSIIRTDTCATYEQRNSNASASSSSSPFAVRRCLSRLLTLLFSTPGLVLLVTLYSLLGAMLFPLLEAPQDVTKSVAIAKSREDCLRELWIITEKLNVLYERNWTMLVHEQLRRFEGSIVAATRHGGLGAIGSTAIAGRFGGHLADALIEPRWTFSEALLYSVTVITTIGHGSLTPKTAAGKVATILYALIGVPLMLMCLSSLGALLAEALQCTYARICCRLVGRGRGSKHPEQQRQQQHKHESDDDGCAEVGVDAGGVEGTGPLDGNDSECHGQSHAMACKSCKYDAIIGKTNLNNGYDDYTINGATLARREESCQLLHNSTTSVNHISPCMQLKSATMAAAHNAQYYQRSNSYMQQQQQQQPLQQQHHHSAYQPSEIAPTSCSSSSPLQSQKCSQPLAAITYCNRSSTPSPQHLQHPLQQNYHIVSANSTNSSPTHHVTNQRQYQPQQQQQQHFVALPSNVVRFQTTAIAAPNSNMLNCYQPASASATIYFPIAAAPAAATTGAAAAPTTAATAVAALTPATVASVATPATSCTQLLYNQPLVKYHTIQLQHKKPSYVTDALAPAGLSSGTAHVTFATTTTAAPLPPPPAYQTATVHGIRRAKFLTKPLPHEINSLLAETDLSCYRNDAQQSTNCNPSSAPAATSAAATTMTTSMNPLATTTTMCSPATATILQGDATLATTATTTTSSVDIMEDEEENEQQRMGNCPHGTPSRVPLISSAKGTTSHACAASEQSSEYHPSSAAKPPGILSQRGGARGLMSSTAASFHRHTLHTFHRSGIRKSATSSNCGSVRRSTARRNCNLHPKSGCYGDTTETSDDDDDDAEDDDAQRSTDFVLNADNDDDVDDDDDCSDVDADHACATHRNAHQGPQVPITIVLLILICYICLGTVIFAFWENWSLIDGAYFCFVTLATIGYGDFLPERTFNGPEVQLFACCAYLLLGLVLVAMSFSILETQLMWKCKRIAVRLKLAKD